MDKSTQELIEEIFSEKLFVILYENPETNGNKIHLAEYVLDDEKFIPVFTTEENLETATEEMELELPVWQIEGALLASMLEDEDLVVVDAGLEEQEDFTGAEIKEVLKDKIADLEK